MGGGGCGEIECTILNYFVAGPEGYIDITGESGADGTGVGESGAGKTNSWYIAMVTGGGVGRETIVTKDTGLVFNLIGPLCGRERPKKAVL